MLVQRVELLQRQLVGCSISVPVDVVVLDLVLHQHIRYRRLRAVVEPRMCARMLRRWWGSTDRSKPSISNTPTRNTRSSTTTSPRSPYETDNTANQLTPQQLDALHQMLGAYQACHDANACWTAGQPQ